MDKCFTWHKLALRACTSFSQKLRNQLEAVLIKFCADTAIFMRIGKYPFSLIGNIDETPTFFDMALSKFTAQKGERECVRQMDKWTNASTHDHFYGKNWADYP